MYVAARDDYLESEQRLARHSERKLRDILRTVWVSSHGGNTHAETLRQIREIATRSYTGEVPRD